MKHLLVAANSPGEITWLRPIAAAAWRELGVATEVVLLPCTFATGQETEVASRMEGVRSVRSVPRYWPLLLWEGARYPRETVLLHLGGDLMYSAFLSWRWGWPSWSYLWARPWWNSAFQGFVTRDQAGVDWLRRRRVGPEKIHVIGDLTVDAALNRAQSAGPRDPRLITFMPGSRERELRKLTPFFLRVAELMRAEDPNLRFQLIVSPFQQRHEVNRLLTSLGDPRLDNSPGMLVDDRLVTRSGLQMRIVQEHGLDRLAESTMAITIPGTKTAEAAVLGVPSLTLIPTNCPEDFPFIGLLGMLDWLPGGRHLKGRLMLRMRDSVGLLAQPNQRAGRALMPEMIGVLTAQEVAREALRLLEPPCLDLVREELRTLYQPLAGAVSRLLLATCETTGPRSS